MTHIIGYHCTRLTDDEISNLMKVGGLVFPTKEFQTYRVQRLIDNKQIDDVVGRRLLEQCCSDDENRANRIWYISQSKLKNESDISSFFRSWGGESLYGFFDENAEEREVAAILSTVGKPCIVKIKIPISCLESNCILASSQDTDYIDCIAQNIEACEVQNVYVYPDDKEFISLTKCNKWMMPMY